MIKLKNIYEAIVNSSLEEYYDALLVSYKKKFDNEEDAETFIEFLKQNDEQIQEIYNTTINIEKEDNGTLLIAYCNVNDNILLLGIVSNKDKMNRTDISAISIWIDRLIEKMKMGKYLRTSPHELSFRLLKHIEDKIDKEGEYKVRKNLGPKINLASIGFELKDKRYSKYQDITLTLVKK